MPLLSLRHVPQVEIKLSDNGSEYIVTDLTEDLGDGVLLPELTRALTQTNLNYREEPKLTFHRSAFKPALLQRFVIVVCDLET